MTQSPDSRPVIQALGVHKAFGALRAVNDVTLEIRAGETLALIGESGSGKTTLGKLLLGLLKPDAGDILLNGSSIVGLGDRELRALRSQMQVVFQEPYESLNPRLKVASIIAEPLVVQKTLSAPERAERVANVLEMVGLPAAFSARRPGELSGGQQQRVGIARAIVAEPSLVVLDEPTASLDRTIRRQITDLLLQLQDDLQLAFLLITHDIASVRRTAGRSAVMFRGHLVEEGPTNDVLNAPGHPYTKALVSAELPARVGELHVPYRLRPRAADSDVMATGCPLAPICPLQVPECEVELPLLQPVSPNHQARCIRAHEVWETTAVTHERTERP